MPLIDPWMFLAYCLGYATGLLAGWYGWGRALKRLRWEQQFRRHPEPDQWGA